MADSDWVPVSSAELLKGTPVGGSTAGQLSDYVVDRLQHPTQSVVPKSTQMQVISPIAGSPQVPASSSVGSEIAQLGDTFRTLRDQPFATIRGGVAGAAEGVMDLLTPLNALLYGAGKAATYAPAAKQVVADALRNEDSWRGAAGRILGGKLDRAAAGASGDATALSPADQALLDAIEKRNASIAAKQKGAPASAAPSPQPPAGSSTVAPASGPAGAPASTPPNFQAVQQGVQDLRREFGADRLGSAVNPGQPLSGTGAALEVAPGPSAMPDMAQRAVLHDLQRYTPGDITPGNVSTVAPVRLRNALMQLIRERARNGGPANSEVALKLDDLLKQHGLIPKE